MEQIIFTILLINLPFPPGLPFSLGIPIFRFFRPVLLPPSLLWFLAPRWSPERKKNIVRSFITIKWAMKRGDTDKNRWVHFSTAPIFIWCGCFLNWMLPFLLSCPENQSFQYHPEKITLLFQSWINKIKNIFLFDIHQSLRALQLIKNWNSTSPGFTSLETFSSLL